MTIEELNLSVRTFNEVKRAGFETISVLQALYQTSDELSKRAKEEIHLQLKKFCIVTADEEVKSDNRKFEMIPIDHLHPHPENPRKDVGDVSELAESIKANGIMQNLTVIPESDGKYKVLIGHRRLSASRLAGLTQLPCTIATNLSRQDQVAIMLTENMQRTDLTVLEQSDGIQMMFDFGCTENEISEKTGLSKKTVKNRRKLQAFDKNELKKSLCRGGTLADYEAIYKLKSETARNNMLKYVGTNDFNWRLGKELEGQKIDSMKNELLNRIKATKATEIDDTDGYKWVKTFYPSDYTSAVPEVLVFCYFYTRGYGISLYVDKGDEEISEEQTRAEKARLIKENQKRLKDIEDKMCKIRNAFVLNADIPSAYTEKLQQWLIKMASLNNFYLDLIKIRSIFFEDYDKHSFEEAKMLFDKLSLNKQMFVCLYAMISNNWTSVINWSCEYEQNDMLDLIYEFLCDFGYEMSDEEKAMQDGTHELFRESEEK